MENPAVKHESTDAPLRLVVWSGVGIIIGLVLVSLLVYGLVRGLSARSPGATVEPMLGTQIPPEPRLQQDPAAEYRQLRAEEDRRLSTYGWVDQKSGTVHIPIERAIELQLQRGFPTAEGAIK